MYNRYDNINKLKMDKYGTVYISEEDDYDISVCLDDWQTESAAAHSASLMCQPCHFPLSLPPHSNQALHFTDNFAGPCIFHEHGDVFLLILYV